MRCNPARIVKQEGERCCWQEKRVKREVVGGKLFLEDSAEPHGTSHNVDKETWWTWIAKRARKVEIGT